jgi:hypothetical protein
MRPRLILLLALLALTVSFMAFLVKDQGEKKMVCSKGSCTAQPPAAQPAETSGGGEMDNGSFHHLIVSTIK